MDVSLLFNLYQRQLSVMSKSLLHVCVDKATGLRGVAAHRVTKGRHPLPNAQK